MDLRQASTEIKRHLGRLQVRLGWMGAIAALLVSLALLEWLTVSLPASDQRAELEAQLTLRREAIRDGRDMKPLKDNSPASQMTAFESFFPPSTDMNLVLGKLYAAAEKEKLVLERGEYRLSEEPGLSLLRYQITLPVKGSQRDITQFVRRILKDIPTLALDGVTMQRPNIGEPLIEAQIRVSLFHLGAKR